MGGWLVALCAASLWAGILVEGLGARGPAGWAAAALLRAGDIVKATGILSPLRGDFGRYLRHRGYAVTLSAGRVTVLGPPRGPLLRLAGAVRSALRVSVARVLPPREGGLLLGLALGDT